MKINNREKVMEMLGAFKARLQRETGTHIKLSELAAVFEGECFLEEVKDRVVNMLDITHAQLTSPSHKREVADARKLCYMVIRKRYPKLPLATIAARFGKKEHSSILHALDISPTLLKTDAAFRSRYRKLLKQTRNS